MLIDGEAHLRAVLSLRRLSGQYRRHMYQTQRSVTRIR